MRTPPHSIVEPLPVKSLWANWRFSWKSISFPISVGKRFSAARAQMPEDLEFSYGRPTIFSGLSKKWPKDRFTLRDCFHLAAKPRVMQSLRPDYFRCRSISLAIDLFMYASPARKFLARILAYTPWTRRMRSG